MLRSEKTELKVENSEECLSLSSFKQDFFRKNLLDSRLVLVFLLFSSTLSLKFTLNESLLAFLPFSFVLLSKHKEKKIKLHFYFLLLTFCFFCFLFSFLVRSIHYENAFFFVNIEENFLFSVEYALHLALVGICGLCAFVWLEAKEYAYAINWFFSFFSKKHAWKIALISLLVLRYFSSFLPLAKEMKLAVKYRLRNEKSFIKKISLYMTTLFSYFAQRNYELSIALFARNMNKKEVFDKKWEQSIFSSFEIFYEHLLLLFLFVFSLLLFFLEF